MRRTRRGLSKLAFSLEPPPASQPANNQAHDEGDVGDEDECGERVAERGKNDGGGGRGRIELVQGSAEAVVPGELMKDFRVMTIQSKLIKSVNIDKTMKE